MSEPKNQLEIDAWDELKRDNWELFRNGSPDIFAEKDGKLMAVEVKSHYDSLSIDQEAMFNLLSRHGIPCYIWRPGQGLKKTSMENKLPVWATPVVLQVLHDRDGWSLRRLAKECGVSHESIRNLIKKAG